MGIWCWLERVKYEKECRIHRFGWTALFSYCNWSNTSILASYLFYTEPRKERLLHLKICRQCFADTDIRLMQRFFLRNLSVQLLSARRHFALFALTYWNTRHCRVFHVPYFCWFLMHPVCFSATVKQQESCSDQKCSESGQKQDPLLFVPSPDLLCFYHPIFEMNFRNWKAEAS